MIIINIELLLSLLISSTSDMPFPPSGVEPSSFLSNGGAEARGRGGRASRCMRSCCATATCGRSRHRRRPWSPSRATKEGPRSPTRWRLERSGASHLAFFLVLFVLISWLSERFQPFSCFLGPSRLFKAFPLRRGPESAEVQALKIGLKPLF